MSFYPEQRPRWPAAVAAGLAGLLIGGVAGGLIGRETAPTLEEEVADIRRDARAVATRLEVVNTEYPQAVSAGRVVGRTEYDGVRARVENAQNALESLRERLRRVDPAGYEEAARAIARLRRDVDARADVETVASDVGRARRALGA
jgi:multidrug resistance efflux pump